MVNKFLRANPTEALHVNLDLINNIKWWVVIHSLQSQRLITHLINASQWIQPLNIRSFPKLQTVLKFEQFLSGSIDFVLFDSRVHKTALTSNWEELCKIIDRIFLSLIQS